VDDSILTFGLPVDVVNIEQRHGKQFRIIYFMKIDGQWSLALACPTCGAEPQEPCELSTGGPRNAPHHDRLRTAADGVNASLDMACLECNWLAAECERLEGVLAPALRALRAGIATSPEQEYTGLRSAVDEAQLDSKVSQLKLAKHRQSHEGIGAASGCAD
jgi:hypothetical protein